MDSKAQSISIFGLGYVGSVMAACLAHKGNQVTGVDVSEPKVETLNAGRSPIIEAQMDQLVAEGRESRRLSATTNVSSAIAGSDVSFICVGTPSQANGRLDLAHVRDVSRGIGAALKTKSAPHTVVLRSTVLPGTTESVVIPALEAASGKRAGVDFAVVYNPEFMREGTAVADFFSPPYTVLGGAASHDVRAVREIYEWAGGNFVETSIRVAEMVKYASNAFHAVKVTFANEIGALAKSFSVDAEELSDIFLSDTRLNVSPAYLRPGFAFGGSCLPKDVRALTGAAEDRRMRLPLLESLLTSNQEHIERAVGLVVATGKKRIGVLGLSFKAGTDDLRESPQVELVRRLLNEGCEVRIWDPNVCLQRLAGANLGYVETVIPNIGALLVSDIGPAIEFADVVVLGTSSAAREMVEPHLRPSQAVIDLANLKKSRRIGTSSTASAYEGICWE